MPISLHLQAKVIVYEMPYLLEILKSRFKKVAQASALFSAFLCTFCLHKTEYPPHEVKLDHTQSTITPFDSPSMPYEKDGVLIC